MIRQGTDLQAYRCEDNAFSNFVGLRNEKPTVVITPMNRSVYREGEKEWHNDSVAFSVYAATDSAGIYSVEIKVNGKTVATDKTGKAVNADFSNLRR